jgi:hypothetical protein
MKKLLAIAFGLSLLGGTLSAVQAQGTGGSPGKHSHGAKHGQRLAPHGHGHGHKGGKKGKKSSGGSTTQPPK